MKHGIWGADSPSPHFTSQTKVKQYDLTLSSPKCTNAGVTLSPDLISDLTSFSLKKQAPYGLPSNQVTSSLIPSPPHLF
jgi:hypothetical protein